MRVEKRIGNLINIICILVFMWIVVCQMILNNGWENKRIVYVAGGLIGVFLLYRWKNFLYQREESIRKYFWIITAVFLILYGMLQLLIALEMRFEPIFDLEAIYGGAKEWHQTGTFKQHEEYFYRFKNNLGGLGILYLANWLFTNFTQDYFLNGILINCIGLSVTFLLMILICREIWGEVSALLCMTCITVYLPFLFIGAAFYTDALSMPYVMGSLFLFLHMKKAENLRSKIVFAICFGICICVGTWIKGTIWLLLIAGVAILLLQRKKKEALICLVSILVSVFLVNALLNSFFYHNYLNDKSEAEKKLAATHWIMMGLEGEGRYNPSDYEFSYQIESAKDRKAANIEEIINRLKKRKISGMIELFADKTVIDYGEGTLGLSDFLDDNPKERGNLHEYVLYDGRHYAGYQSYCRIVMLVFWICFLYEMLQRTRQKELHDEYLFVEFAQIGLFAFLMIWESGPRYISNYVPFTILGATVGIGNLKKINIEEAAVEQWKQKGIAILQKIKETPVFVYARKQWKKRSIRIFSYSVIFRMVIYLFSICIMAMFGDYQEGITVSDFLEAWKRWDSTHYLNIAENGYSGAVENGQHLFLVFYPLYPWLIKILHFLVGDYRLAGIIISVVCYGIGNVYLDKLMCKEYSSEAAKKAVCYLAIYPFSFFFGAILTESLYFALLTIFLYNLRKHKWWEVAFFGFLICMTKVQGLLLTLSVIAELFYSYHGIRLIKEHQWGRFWKKIICNGLRCVPMVGGIFVYLMINYLVEGDPFRFMYYQKEHWGNSLCPIWNTISYLKYNGTQEWTTSFGMSQWLPEYLLIFVYAAAIIYGIRKKMRPTYLVYLISFFTLTYSSTWLISAARYSLSALPIFMLAGKFMEEHKKWTRPIMVVAYGFMMIYMIGFYQWKSIM